MGQVTHNIERASRAIKASIKVAHRQGLNFDQPIVLSDRGNVVIHFTPTPVIVRMSELAGSIRSGDHWFTRELVVCQHMAAQ
ncbi:hypothetical protein IQ266_13750, partial [filamentous cyanobacterium LEGE 11480]